LSRFFLGIVEGLTEFLPVSSTAHLRIVEAMFGLNLHDSFWKMYTIVIQLGAILACRFIFGTESSSFWPRFRAAKRGDRTVLTHPLSLTLIAFVVTALPAFLLKKQIGQNLESLSVMAWALLIGGVVMLGRGCGLHEAAHESHGRNEFAAGHLDRRGPKFCPRFFPAPRDRFDYRRGPDRGTVALGRARVFIFCFHPDDGRRDRLRFAENACAAP